MTLIDRGIMFAATGCYIGKIGPAPGTLASFLGLGLCFFLTRVDFWLAALLAGMIVVAAVWLSHEAEKILKSDDPACVVIDEVAGMAITLLGLPFNAVTVAIGFVLFRALDIAKPFPIRLLHRRLNGGIGIVADDLAAGLAANLILRLILSVLGVAY